MSSLHTLPNESALLGLLPLQAKEFLFYTHGNGHGLQTKLAPIHKRGRNHERVLVNACRKTSLRPRHQAVRIRAMHKLADFVLQFFSVTRRSARLAFEEFIARPFKKLDLRIGKQGYLAEMAR